MLAPAEEEGASLVSTVVDATAELSSASSPETAESSFSIATSVPIADKIGTLDLCCTAYPLLYFGNNVTDVDRCLSVILHIEEGIMGVMLTGVAKVKRHNLQLVHHSSFHLHRIQTDEPEWKESIFIEIEMDVSLKGALEISDLAFSVAETFLKEKFGFGANFSTEEEMGSSYFGEPSLGNGRSGSSRKGKKSNSEKPKPPQRGLGVAQLEKIRLHNQMGCSYLPSLHSPYHTNLNQVSLSLSPLSL
ncbi:hypothetical protein HHK36_021645 [Tetracentron sinense]|uniref:Uncharacterized protein n=1 Tax=Tetracentron sinense TaxID=13715 RepID=A0A834YVN3_TETSI|nr:hypothetical protein HHK36_021645 [Tetracentron sinense]